jgi:hypothetical protein
MLQEEIEQSLFGSAWPIDKAKEQLRRERCGNKTVRCALRRAFSKTYQDENEPILFANAWPTGKANEEQQLSDDCLRMHSIVIKGLMRKITLALIVAMLPTWGAAEQTNRSPKHLKKAVTTHSVIGNPCAQYGPGFTKIAGSDTCIKIGGSVGAEAGGSSRR